MVYVNIIKNASYENLDLIRRFFRGVNFKSVEITMEYDCQRGLPDEKDTKKWPFKAYLVGEKEIYDVQIYNLSVGYGGTGPHDFADILNFFKVPFDEEDVFTKRRMGHDGVIRLKFSR